MVSSIESSKDVEIMLDLGWLSWENLLNNIRSGHPDLLLRNQSLSIPFANSCVLLTSFLEIFPHNNDWTMQLLGRTCFLGV
jgi:hypothetical protein